jgi:hypothetical protein
MINLLCTTGETKVRSEETKQKSTWGAKENDKTQIQSCDE